MSVQVESDKPILTHADRCDRCGSRAFVLTIIVWSPTFRGNGELKWCRHHWNKHREALAPMIAVLIDETAQLTKHATDDGGPR